jgi:poly-beta-1,6-N-acetyl-D-glucosamine synthase
MLPELFTWVLAGSVLLYAVLILRCLVAWQKIPEQNVPAGFTPSTRISVLVPVRNEADYIQPLLADFAALHYPLPLFEVLVADDHSTDGTGRLVQEFALNSPYLLHYLDLRQVPGRQGKKGAILAAHDQAQGDLIVCTDGDCRVQPEWLRLLAFLYETGQPKFVSGPVCFYPADSFFAKLQLVEFAALIGVGAGSIQLGQPNMCNGANVAYEKKSFQEVGGYAGNEQIASGDDEFLLHKMHRAFPEKIRFLKAKASIVYTGAQKNGKAFLEQRTRWASKWRHYQRKEVQGLAVLVFGVNLLLLLGLPLAILGQLSSGIYWGALAGKVLVDFVFLYQILAFLDCRRLILYALPLQVVYVPYVVLTALAGLYGQYEWKGRQVT